MVNTFDNLRQACYTVLKLRGQYGEKICTTLERKKYKDGNTKYLVIAIFKTEEN